MTNTKNFYTDLNHDHFFIKNGSLYEGYKTLRGIRIRHRLDLQDESDCERLTAEQIKEIEIKYLK